jgi:beta-glucosidase
MSSQCSSVRSYSKALSPENRLNTMDLRLLLLAALASLVACAATAQDVAELSPRVRALLEKMTIDEKLGMVQGSRDPAYNGGAGYIAGVPRLDVPPLRMADGPSNVYVRYETTALPQPITLAATFSTDLARQYGEILGRESRATRNDVLLGPMVNISRLPHWGRNVTSSGEEPLVIARIAAAEIGGIQSTGVMANAKHFIANNQSLNQGGGIGGADGFDFIVDERTLHEIYLPGFESAMRAGVASIMAAYNKTNGFWNAENESNLTGILRKELGWKGFVVSDWHANRSTPSIAAGLDMEMPGQGPVYLTGREGPKWGQRLKAAIDAKQVDVSALDRAAGRVLTQMERFGFLDGKRVAGPATIDVEAHAQFARKLAAQGAVLLKNEGGFLPLEGERRTNLLIVGPTAAQLGVGPGVSGFESRFVPPLEALRRSLGAGASVTHVVGDELTGVPIPAEFTRIESDSTVRGVDASINFTGANALPVGRGYKWRGTLTAPVSGKYALQVHSWGGTGTLSIEGQARAFSAAVRFGHGIPRKTSSVVPTTDGLDNAQWLMDLEAGKAYPIEVQGQAEPESKLQIRLAWVTPQMRAENIAAAVDAAKTAGTVVVFAWARSGEFDDPDLAMRLPNDQDAMIGAIAAANPNTVVVFNSSSPHDMPWRDQVKSILYMWFPGQEGGWATADVLLGKENPSGRLPLTFPVRPRDVAALDPAHPARYRGEDKRVVYSEGIFHGYRHFDEHGIAPLHPFGYGLSYTTFAYSNLRTRATGDGHEVSFTVRNTGQRRGADVPQVYLGRPAQPPAPMAPQTLVGFERVELKPGESRAVKIRIEPRQLSYWSSDEDRWKVASGRRAIYVGASSRDVKLTGSVDVRPRT